MVDDAASRASTSGAVSVEVLSERTPSPADAAAPASLDWLVPEAVAEPEPELAYPAGLHAAELLEQEHKRARVRLSREPSPRWVSMADYVEPALLSHAVETRQRVLVESDGRGHLCVVGMLQTRVPEVTTIRGKTIEIEAAESLTLKSGRAGLRFRADGDVELVGSRISAASRGLLRLVGKALRLN